MTQVVMVDGDVPLKVLVHKSHVNGVPVCYDIVYDESFSQAVTLDFAFRDVPGVNDESLLSLLKHRLTHMKGRKEVLFYVNKALESLRRSK